MFSRLLGVGSVCALRSSAFDVFIDSVLAIFALRVKQRQPEVCENVNRLYYVYGSNVNLWWFRVLLGVGWV